MPKDRDHSLLGAERLPYADWRPLKPNGHFTLTKPHRDRIHWLRDVEVVRRVFFWLHAPGEALGLDGALHLDRVAHAMRTADRVEAERMSLLAFQGSFVNKCEIVVPEPVLAHVNGTSLHPGVWVWSTRNRFELWGDSVRSDRYSGAIAGAPKKKLPRAPKSADTESV